MSLETFLENLADPAFPLSNSDFIELSDLAPAELGVFARHWFLLSQERKRAILTTMVELAEDSPGAGLLHHLQDVPEGRRRVGAGKGH